jgi:hypothetical protein
MTAAAHSTPGSLSRGDVILSDTSSLLGVTVRMAVRNFLDLLVDGGGGGVTY